MVSDENRSIQAVIEYERKRGRKAVDARRSHLGEGIDVVSDGSTNIQVKSNKNEPSMFWLSLTDFERLQTDPNYRVYYVYDLTKRPRVVVIPAETLRALLVPEIRFVVQPSKAQWKSILDGARLRGDYDEVDVPS